MLIYLFGIVKKLRGRQGRGFRDYSLATAARKTEHPLIFFKDLLLVDLMFYMFYMFNRLGHFVIIGMFAKNNNKVITVSTVMCYERFVPLSGPGIAADSGTFLINRPFCDR